MHAIFILSDSGKSDIMTIPLVAAIQTNGLPSVVATDVPPQTSSYKVAINIMIVPLKT